MDQNQTTVDNDLQKAIDDITKTTSIDPVFSDPVAAPSSVPEGDTGELGEPIGPFPEPVIETPVETKPVNPEDALPEFDVPPVPPVPEMPEPAPEIQLDTTTLSDNTTLDSSHGLSMRQVKEAALRDLIPLMDRLSMTPSQKFNIYRNIFEDLRDYTVLEPAYHAATEIADETERAEALLYLVESIDKM